MKLRKCGWCPADDNLRKPEDFCKGARQCRACRKNYRHKIYLKNAAQEKMAGKLWAQNNRAKWLGFKRKYNKKAYANQTPEQRALALLRRKAFWVRHQPRLSELKKKYYAKNRAHILARTLQQKYETRWGEMSEVRQVFNQLTKEIKKRKLKNAQRKTGKIKCRKFEVSSLVDPKRRPNSKGRHRNG